MKGIKFGSTTAAVAIAGIILIVYGYFFLGIGCFALALIIHFAWGRIFKKT